MYWENSAGCRPAVSGGQPLPALPLLSPYPPFPLTLPFHSLHPPLPQIQLGDLGQRYKLPQRGPGQSPCRKCIFSIILSHGNVSGSNNVAPFCADKLSVETEKTHIFNCDFVKLLLLGPWPYNSEEVQQALNPLYN